MSELTNYPIGLDISDSILRLIQLKPSSSFRLWQKESLEKININCYNETKLAPGLIVNGEIKKPTEVIKQLNLLLSTVKGGNLNSKETIAVLPTNQTFIKLFQLPPTAEDQLETVIKEEILKHFPINLDDIYIDWQIIDQQKDQWKVLVGTAPKIITDQYVDVLTKASLQPTVMEIESAALCRCLIPDTKNDKMEDGPYLIIDLGANRSSVIIGSNQTVYLTINPPISGDSMTNQIASSLTITTDQAEKVKKVCGLNKENCQGVVRELLDGSINVLFDHILQATSFFQNAYPQKQIKQVLLSGGGASFINLDQILFDYLKIPVVKGNPWLKINQEKNFYLQQLNTNGLSYTTAIGLALRGLIE